LRGTSEVQDEIVVEASNSGESSHEDNEPDIQVPNLLTSNAGPSTSDPSLDDSEFVNAMTAGVQAASEPLRTADMTGGSSDIAAIIPTDPGRREDLADVVHFTTAHEAERDDEADLVATPRAMTSKDPGCVRLPRGGSNQTGKYVVTTRALELMVEFRQILRV
jgi:hypothetical protein